MNGVRNGQVIVSERDFKRIHLAADGLSVMLVRDTSRGGEHWGLGGNMACRRKQPAAVLAS